MSSPKVKRYKFYTGLFGGVYEHPQGNWCGYEAAANRYHESETEREQLRDQLRFWRHYALVYDECLEGLEAYTEVTGFTIPKGDPYYTEKE